MKTGIGIISANRRIRKQSEALRNEVQKAARPSSIDGVKIPDNLPKGVKPETYKKIYDIMNEK